VGGFDSETLIRLLAQLPVLFFALTVHEFAHAWMAVRCGDSTPQEQGRVTLNPLAHLDPMGTLMILVTVLGGVGFGWGRPVSVNPYRFRSPRRDELLVSAAGPASNILQATVWSALFPLVALIGFQFGYGSDPLYRFLLTVFSYGVLVNLVLAAFNLLPLFPLDGEKVLVQLLPLQWARKVIQLRPKGSLALLGLFLIGWVTPFNVLWWWIQAISWPFLVFLEPGSGWLSRALAQALG